MNEPLDAQSIAVAIFLFAAGTLHYWYLKTRWLKATKAQMKARNRRYSDVGSTVMSIIGIAYSPIAVVMVPFQTIVRAGLLPPPDENLIVNAVLLLLSILVIVMWGELIVRRILFMLSPAYNPEKHRSGGHLAPESAPLARREFRGAAPHAPRQAAGGPAVEIAPSPFDWS